MLNQEEAQYIDSILQQFKEFLRSYIPTPITNYSRLQEDVSAREFIDSCSKLEELMQKPEEFKKAFLAYFHQRREHLAGTALSFTALPLGAANQIYWQLLRQLFKPQTLNEMFAIVFPQVKKIRSIMVQELLPPSMNMVQFTQTPPFFIQDQLLSAYSDEQLDCPEHMGSFIILDDYLFLLNNIATLSFDYHQQIYLLLKEQCPELAVKIYSHNREWEVLEQDILLCFGQNPREALATLCKGLILGGEKITGQRYASETAHQACKRFTIYWNHLPSEFKERLNQLEDAHGTSLADILHVLLDQGGCVETAAAQLKSVLMRAENAELLNFASSITPEAKEAIALKYTSERNPQGISLEGQETVDKLPQPYLGLSLEQIQIHSLEDFLELLIRFPSDFYPVLLSSITIQNDNLFWELKLLTTENILSDEQSLALNKAIENSSLHIRAVLIHAIASDNRGLFEEKLSALSLKEAKLVLESRDAQGETLLHGLANKPLFLAIILKLYQSPSEQKRLVQLPGKYNQTMIHRAIPTIEALKILLDLCPTDEFKLSLFSFNNVKSILEEAAPFPAALSILFQSFTHPENCLKALQVPLKNGATLLHQDTMLTRPLSMQAVLNTLPWPLRSKLMTQPSPQKIDLLQTAFKHLDRYKETISVLVDAIPLPNRWSLLLTRCIAAVLSSQGESHQFLQWSATTKQAFAEMKQLVETQDLSLQSLQSWADSYIEPPKSKANSPYFFFTISEQDVLKKILEVIRCYKPEPNISFEQVMNPIAYR